MSSKKLWLKIYFFACYTISPFLLFPHISLGNSFSESFQELSCVKDLKEYYPFFKMGELSLDEQDRFFGCVWAFLDAVVNKKIITHTPERDHFTEHEIFKMFHILFEYEKEHSQELTKKLLFYKKFLIGGSIQTFRDEELSQLLKLVFDYKEVYYILHREIPNFKKLFQGDNVSSETKTLEQLRKASLLISRAYQREDITYTIEDLYKYPEYAEIQEPQAMALFSILQNVFEGLLFPQKEIQGGEWTVFVNVIRRSFDLLFYHNQHLQGNLRDIELAYNGMTALQKMISILASNERLFSQRGFPIKNIDGILQSSLELVKFNNETLSFIRDQKQLRFLTRVFFTLSLSDKNPNSPDEKEAYLSWENEDSLVDYVFPDSRFSLTETKLTEETKTEINYFVSSQKIKLIEEWSKNYQEALLSINQGFIENTANEKGLGHWLDLFFGWSEEKQIIYGEFRKTDNYDKMTDFLSYQAFLSLILKSYVPETYFESDEQELTQSEWKRIISDLAPALSFSLGGEDFQTSQIKSMEDLFSVADLFLNSSNTNEKLDRKELLDLAIHLISSLKHSQKILPQLNVLCDDELFLDCVTEALLNSPEMLQPYPRFKDHIFSSQRKKYKNHIQSVLSGWNKGESSSQLLELFFLIQVMEVNYYQKINTNLSFNLEYEELLDFAHSLKEPVSSSIPYLYNSEQALAFLLYSFQTQEIPFFTGTEFEPIRFTHWYLNPQIRSDFSITPNDFHDLAFQFYQLYKRF